MEDVIYIGDDERNATVDHRTRTGGRPTGWNGRAPQSRAVVVPAGSRRPTVVYSGGNASTAGYYQPQMFVAQQSIPFAARFGLTTGELIDAGLQIFAALQALPPAPTAQGDSSIDTENLVTYQKALAAHAKRDEQLRTVGNLLIRVLR